jgi:hypothetical protein
MLAMEQDMNEVLKTSVEHLDECIGQLVHSSKRMVKQHVIEKEVAERLQWIKEQLAKLISN